MSLTKIDLAALATVIGGQGRSTIPRRGGSGQTSIAINGQQIDPNGPMPPGVSIDTSGGGLDITVQGSGNVTQ
jgi:hypothetical protein